MTFLLRGSVVALSVFFLAYFVLSALLVIVWRMWGGRHALRSAHFLYGIRMLPIAGALVLVLGFAVPSFLYFEPRFEGEPIGWMAFSLAASGLLVLIIGAGRSFRAWFRTSRIVSPWLTHSRELETRSGTRSYAVVDVEPAFLVAGIWRPALLVSSGAVALLECDEVEAAIRHELAHVRRRDNLKKLLLRFCAFPLLAPLESEWLNTSELEADDAAARDEREALALASALVKMARAAQHTAIPELVMTFAAEGAVGLRVERLLAWKPLPRRSHWPAWISLFSLGAVTVSVNYVSVLATMHELTELLIR